jgi:hypothetical protein
MDPSEALPPELERFWRTDDGLTAWERAASFGLDLSLIDENLRLTPAERIERNEAALRLMNALQASRSHVRT